MFDEVEMTLEQPNDEIGVYEVPFDEDMDSVEFVYLFKKEVESKIGLDISPDSLLKIARAGNPILELEYDDTVLELISNDAMRAKFVALLDDARERYVKLHGGAWGGNMGQWVIMMKDGLYRYRCCEGHATRRLALRY